MPQTNVSIIDVIAIPNDQPSEWSGSDDEPNTMIPTNANRTTREIR